MRHHTVGRTDRADHSQRLLPSVLDHQAAPFSRDRVNLRPVAQHLTTNEGAVDVEPKFPAEDIRPQRAAGDGAASRRSREGEQFAQLFWLAVPELSHRDSGRHGLSVPSAMRAIKTTPTWDHEGVTG